MDVLDDSDVVARPVGIAQRSIPMPLSILWTSRQRSIPMSRSVLWTSPQRSISAEETLCFSAHHVWIRVRGGYVTFGWNYKPTPIETYRNPADRLCVAGIGSSDFHLADFGFGRLLRLSPLRSNFAECTFTVPTQFESRLYSIFFGRDPFSIGITFYIHHFLYIYFQKHNKEFYSFICIIWFTNTTISES